MVKIQFTNLPDTTTPVNADNLNAVQTNTENAINEVDGNIDLATKTLLSTTSGKDQEISNCAGASGKLNIDSGETEQDGEPTPINPVNIISVGSNINLFDEELEQGSINGSTGENASSNTIIRSKNYIEIPDGVDTLRLIRTNVGTSAYAIGLRFYNSSKTYLEAATYNTNLKYFDISIIANAKYLRFVDLSNDLTNKYKVTTDLGSSGYTQYNAGGIDYKVQNKNLFDKNNRNVINAQSQSSTITSKSNMRMLYIPCKANTTYTIQKRNDGSSNVFQVGTTTTTPAVGVAIAGIQSHATYTSISITTSETSQYLICTYFNTNDTILTEQQMLDSIQIEENSTATTYVEHKGQIATIPLPQDMELCKIGDYKDYLYKANGKWYKHKEIEKYIFTGSESFSLGATFNTVARFYSNFISGILNTTAVANAKCYSNYFKWYSDQANNTNFNNSTNDIEAIHIRDDKIGLGIKIDKTIASTSNAMKAYCLDRYNEGNPIIAYFPLETPVEEEITDKDTIYYLEHFPIYKEYTNIECINDVKPDMHIDYLYDNEVNNYWGAELDSLAEKLHNLEVGE